jgi:hypothetical protein
LIGKQEKSTNALGFRKWQGVEAESALSLEAQGWAPFSGKTAGATLRIKWQQLFLSLPWSDVT